MPLSKERLTEPEIERQSLIAPFPPASLMRRVSGLTSNSDFASHGRDIFRALQKSSSRPITSFDAILDFGVGSGRLARMFAGFTGKYIGVDIDHELLNWTAAHLPWVTPLRTTPRQSLPLASQSFDCVISISVFTHLNQSDCTLYLDELRRVARPGACLLLTVHGERSLQRAETEKSILDMLSVPRADIQAARNQLDAGGFQFIRQKGHLTTNRYDYGITFVSESYVRSCWSSGFEIEDVVTGAIHDFQDIVVLRRSL